MKLAKLSLAAIVVAGLATSSFAADNLADAFKNGKVSGELRAWYFDRDTNNGLGLAKGDTGIANFGVQLGYVTDSLYGFSVGATFQSNSAAFASNEAKQLFATDEYGSGASLSEAYLAYNMKNTTVKVGRQYIATPLVGSSPGRMMREAFEGAVIVNTDLPATTLIGGYVTKFQGRTGTVENTLGTGLVASTYDAGGPSFQKAAVFYGAKNASGSTLANDYLAFDGAYTVGIINKSLTNLALTAQYAVINDVATLGDVDIYYVEANYVLPLSGFKLGFDLNYRGSKTATALDVYNLEGTYTAARVSISELAGFGASLAYGTTSNDDAAILGVGNSPAVYTGTLIRASAPQAAKSTDSYRFDITYDFSKVGVAGLKALGSYGYAKQDLAADTKYTSYAGAVSYDVAAIKGLSLIAQYETQEKEDAKSVDTNEFRFLANYKF